MDNQQGYDEAVKQLNAILEQMESATTPLSMDQYVVLARKAKALIEECKSYLTGVEKDIQSITGQE